MIVVLEGGCGSGKTMLGRALSEITGVRMYRPFRGGEPHISSELVHQMEDMGLSINGWEEDIYVADILAHVGPSVILDRSMPSALVYSRGIEGNRYRAILGLWAERIVRARATLVYVACNEPVRAERAPDRGGLWESNGIENVLRTTRTLQPDIPIIQVRGDAVPAKDVANALARRITLGTQSQLLQEF